MSGCFFLKHGVGLHTTAMAYSEREREFTFAKNGPFSAIDARYDATRADRHENGTDV